MDGTKQSILVVDDEPNIRRALRMVLEPEGFALLEAESAEKGLEILQAEPVDLAMFDIRLPGMDGLTLLGKARELWRDLPVVVMSGHADTSDIVDAMRRGDTDFIPKPVDRERVLVSVQNALSRRTLEEKVQSLASRERRFADEMLGESATMGRLREDIAKVAPTTGRVLVLDEIGDMSLSAQAKVLRALQTGEITRVGSEKAIQVDVRVVAATNKDLETEVREGNFREDLYFRLAVVPLRAPALRDRLEDVPLLAERFFQLAVRENGLRPKPVDPSVHERLRAYRWPGNVRELRNVCERMVIMSGDRIGPADVPEGVAPRAAPAPAPGAADLSQYGEVPLKDLRDLVERDYILKKLEEHDWNITQAAQALGVERTNLHKKIKQHGLSRAGRAAAADAEGAED